MTPAPFTDADAEAVFLATWDGSYEDQDRAEQRARAALAALGTRVAAMRAEAWEQGREAARAIAVADGSNFREAAQRATAAGDRERASDMRQRAMTCNDVAYAIKTQPNPYEYPPHGDAAPDAPR